MSLWAALRPGDKWQLTFLCCTGQHQADVEGRGRGAAAERRPWRHKFIPETSSILNKFKIYKQNTQLDVKKKKKSPKQTQ